jgi:hypothetical protein
VVAPRVKVAREKWVHDQTLVGVKKNFLILKNFKIFWTNGQKSRISSKPRGKMGQKFKTRIVIKLGHQAFMDKNTAK